MQPLGGDDDTVNALAYSKDGKFLASGGFSRKIGTFSR